LIFLKDMVSKGQKRHQFKHLIRIHVLVADMIFVLQMPLAALAWQKKYIAS